MITVYLQVYLGDLFVKFLFLVLQLFSRITGGCEGKSAISTFHLLSVANV